MNITYLPIKQLTPLESNPRKITGVQFDKLKKSLKKDPKFFECRPCLVNIEPDGTKRIYAGNQRYQAAKKLGFKEIPCYVDDNLDEKIIHERILKDNVHYGSFDYDILYATYEIDDLIDSGLTPEDLTGDFGVEKVESKEPKEKEKKLSMCPHCGQEF